MELVGELIFTAFFAVLFSFLVAKLVSFAMVNGDSSSSVTELRDVDQDTAMEELLFGEKLNVAILESENRVVFVEESLETVDKFEEDLNQVEKVEKSAAEEEEEVIELSKDSSDENEANTEVDSVLVKENQVFGEKLIVAICESGVKSAEEVIEVPKDSLQENEANRGDDSVSVQEIEESALNNDVIDDQCGEKESKTGHKLVSDQTGHKLVGDQEDDDDEWEQWEGIERSELEKVFGAAAKLVMSGDMDDLLSDLQMELYGLHKIATEGTCHESQPMALMVSSRAKWNAWQKLGNMSPEEAMDRYVALLSERIPGWMEKNYSGDNKLESAEAGKPYASVPDISSSSGHQTNYTHERNPEMKSDSVGGDLTESSSLESQAKE